MDKEVVWRIQSLRTSCLRSGAHSLIDVVVFVSGLGMRVLYFETCHCNNLHSDVLLRSMC